MEVERLAQLRGLSEEVEAAPPAVQKPLVED